VDEQNPNTLALVRGPLALFAIGRVPPKTTREQLLAATAVSQSSDDWRVQSDTDKFTLRPFAGIGSEPYRLYHKLEG
jgi:hypothetical protein